MGSIGIKCRLGRSRKNHNIGNTPVTGANGVIVGLCSEVKKEHTSIC